METLLAVAPDMMEEIEVLLQDHERLMDAAREELSRSTSRGLSTDSFETDSWRAHIKDSPIKVDIFRNQSIDKTTNKKKQQDFSRATKFVANPFQQKFSNSTPPLSLANTFDTEPTTSSSDDEGRYPDGNSITSGETENDEMTPDLFAQEFSGSSDFSRLSIVDISTIIEEQQKERKLIKDKEVQREQDQIDQGLQFLHDDSTIGTYLRSEYNEDILECIEEEVNHEEIALEVAGDGSRYLLPLDKAIGNNTVAELNIATGAGETATTQKSNARGVAEEYFSSDSNMETPTSQGEEAREGYPPRIDAKLVDCAKAEERPKGRTAISKSEDADISSPRVEEITVNLSAFEKLSTVKTDEKLACDNFVEKGEHDEQLDLTIVAAKPPVGIAEKSFPLLLVEAESSFPATDDIVSTTEDIEEFPMKAPPPSPVRKSTRMQQNEKETEEPTALTLGTDQLPVDPMKRSLSVSKLLRFKPIDFDEMNSPINHEAKEPMMVAPILPDISKPPDDPHYVPQVLVLEDNPEEGDVGSIGFSDILDDDDEQRIEDPFKTQAMVTESQKPCDYVDLSTTPSAPMDELHFYLNNAKPKPPNVRGGYFGWFKLFCLVTTTCILGTVGYRTDRPSLVLSLNTIQAELDISYLPRHSPIVDKHSAKRHRKFWQNVIRKRG